MYCYPYKTALNQIESNQDRAPSGDGTSFHHPTGLPSMRRRPGFFWQEAEKLQKSEVLYIWEVYPYPNQNTKGLCTCQPLLRDKIVSKAGVSGRKKNKPQLKSNKTPDRQLISILWELMYVPFLFIYFGGTQGCASIPTALVAKP